MAQAPVILIVDDDFDFVQINKLILESQGYAVLCAYDQNEALGLLRDQTPDLIMTDLMMKSIDAGFAFTKTLKKDERLRNIPVIIATSVSSQMGFDFHPKTPADMAAMGVDAYFDKPIPAPSLLQAVRDLLAKAKKA